MVGMLVADKTPAKRKRAAMKLEGGKWAKGLLESNGRKSDQTDSEDDNEKKATRSKSHRQRRIEDDDEDDDRVIVLPKDVLFLAREMADEFKIWDDPSDTARTLKVVCHGESLQPPSALPITATRPKGKDKVGYAAQSFNVPEIAGVMSGWISGFVELPAGAIKDAEGVGECSQVFFLADCQDNAVEMGLADPREEEWQDDIAQRTLLRKGDSFFVPPGNIYRLENHSSYKSCTLFWTIVKPLENPQ
jgi:hypothetical protein